MSKSTLVRKVVIQIRRGDAARKRGEHERQDEIAFGYYAFVAA